MQNLFKTAAEDNIKSIRSYVTELKERVAKLQYQKQLLVCQVLTPSAPQHFIIFFAFLIEVARVRLVLFAERWYPPGCERVVLGRLYFSDNAGARTRGQRER